MRIGFVLFAAAVLPAFAGAPRNDWNRLAGVSTELNVKVRLLDGRVLRGTIQQFGSDGLALMQQKNLTRLPFKRIDGPVSWARGQTAEIKLRDGSALNGRIQEIDNHDEWIWLAEPAAADRIPREDVVRVTSNNRGKSAKFGALGGAAALTALLVAGPKDSLGPGESAAGAWGATIGGGLALGALFGALFGYIIGWPSTIYQAH